MKKKTYIFVIYILFTSQKITRWYLLFVVEYNLEWHIIECQEIMY